MYSDINAVSTIENCILLSALLPIEISKHFSANFFQQGIGVITYYRIYTTGTTMTILVLNVAIILTFTITSIIKVILATACAVNKLNFIGCATIFCITWIVEGYWWCLNQKPFYRIAHFIRSEILF